jgi:hypothetical protein
LHRPGFTFGENVTQPIRILAMTCLLLLGLSSLSHATDQAAPPPPGKMIDLGGHHLHVHCTGHGSPLVVVETGLGDFSFDWTLVQARVARFTRICTYDRAGYAWSEPGPLPRSFAQINLELHDALKNSARRDPLCWPAIRMADQWFGTTRPSTRTRWQASSS